MKFEITKIFPIILITLDIGAAVVYFVHGDKAKSLYWIAASVITLSTLFM